MTVSHPIWVSYRIEQIPDHSVFTFLSWTLQFHAPLNSLGKEPSAIFFPIASMAKRTPSNTKYHFRTFFIAPLKKLWVHRNIFLWTWGEVGPWCSITIKYWKNNWKIMLFRKRPTMMDISYLYQLKWLFHSDKVYIICLCHLHLTARHTMDSRVMASIKSWVSIWTCQYISHLVLGPMAGSRVGIPL